MPESDGLDYGRMMQRALRGLMAEVLGHVAEHGLPGDHHFYIGFDTQHPGVDIAPWLRERYPREMVIVLQEWFEDLAVMGDRFQVTLNFSNRPETLVVPFDAVETFIDPSVKFGLKFDEYDRDAEGEEFPYGASEAEADTPEEPDPDPAPGGGSADVVRLDQFRKS